MAGIDTWLHARQIVVIGADYVTTRKEGHPCGYSKT